MIFILLILRQTPSHTTTFMPLFYRVIFAIHAIIVLSCISIWWCLRRYYCGQYQIRL